MATKRRLNKSTLKYAGMITAILGVQAGLYTLLSAITSDEEPTASPVQPQIEARQDLAPSAHLTYEAKRGPLVAIFEINDPRDTSQNCLVGVSGEESVMTCFAADGPLPTGETLTILPIFDMESGTHNRKPRMFAYKPASNDSLSCLVIHHSTDLDIECRATATDSSVATPPPVASGNRYTP